MKGKLGSVFYTSFQISVKVDFSASLKFTIATFHLVGLISTMKTRVGKC